MPEHIAVASPHYVCERSGVCSFNTPIDVTDAMIEAGAVALAGEPSCYCDDDWRVPRFSGCPRHGDGEWPPDYQRRRAERVLRAALVAPREEQADA